MLRRALFMIFALGNVAGGANTLANILDNVKVHKRGMVTRNDDK